MKVGYAYGHKFGRIAKGANVRAMNVYHQPILVCLLYGIVVLCKGGLARMTGSPRYRTGMCLHCEAAKNLHKVWKIVRVHDLENIRKGSVVSGCISTCSFNSEF